jgi:hypothetical protein
LELFLKAAGNMMRLGLGLTEPVKNNMVKSAKGIYMTRVMMIRDIFC